MTGWCGAFSGAGGIVGGPRPFSWRSPEGQAGALGVGHSREGEKKPKVGGVGPRLFHICWHGLGKRKFIRYSSTPR